MKRSIIAILLLAFQGCQTAPQQQTTIELPPAVVTAADTPRIENGWEMIDSNDTSSYERIVPTYASREVPSAIAWQTIRQGLEYAEIDLPMQCNIGDSKVRIVRADLAHVSLRLLAAGELGIDKTPADEYCTKYKALAVINSSMFADANRSNAFMKNGSYVNNPVLGKDKAIIAFNPVNASHPPFKIIDTTCEDWSVWKSRYRTFIQNIRIVDCNRTNRWSKQEKFWSCAFMGEDEKGRALFIHSRTPYRVHDLANMLLKLPIQLRTCCYLEGGPEASLYVQMPQGNIAQFGSFETGFVEDDNNAAFWPVPNLIAIVPKN